MYEEKETKFDWKGFLLKLAFAIVVIILIIQLLPLKKSEKTVGLEIKENVLILKESAYDYFKINKLPENLNDSIKVSLKDLTSVGAVKSLIDEKGNVCDTEKSYIKATKAANDYDIEVYLVCGKKSETAHLYLGCYNGCTTTTTTTTTAKKTTTKKATTKKKTTASNKTTAKPKAKTTTKVKTTIKTTTTAPLRYTVIFNPNGGSGINSQYVLAGRQAARPADPIRTGYIFVGWYQNNGMQYDFGSPVNANLILRAEWKAIIR